MRKFLGSRVVATLVVLGVVAVAGPLFVAPAHAFTLQPANSAGQGKWVVFGGAISTVLSDAPTQTMSYGVLGTYGVTDNLDLSLGYAINSLTNLPAPLTADSSSMLGGSAKIEWIKQGATAPVSLATSLVYVGNSSKLKVGAATGTSDVADWSVGVVVSKFYMTAVPVLPYASAAYKTIQTKTAGVLGAATKDELGFEFALGNYFIFSRQLALFLEYSTLRRTTFATGAGGTSTQW